MRRTVATFAALTMFLAGCDSGREIRNPSPDTHSGHGDHHDPKSDPRLVPAGESGTPALGQPVATMSDLSAWVQEATGECADVTTASMDDLADYLGPARATWYEPFVAEWATCGIEPYDKLGLVLFEPGRQRALQEFWSRGLASGEISDNPDWAFGNGFAITAGPVGTERLGLRYLWCEPGDPGTPTIPADVTGCVYAAPPHG